LLSSKPNTQTLTNAGGSPDSQISNLRRLSIFGAIAVIEMVLSTFLFDFDQAMLNLSYWRNPLVYANALAKITVVAFALFSILALSRRNEIVEAHNSAVANDRGISYYLVGNIILFAALLLTKFAFSRALDVSVFALWTYILLLAAVGISLALVAAPLSFWKQLIKLTPIEIGIAYACATVAVVGGYLSQEGWDSLSSATLNLSHWFLSLYESNVLLDNENWILGVGEFRVQVFHGCSGYEGVALMTAFLAVYTWVFRRDLRFPNVLLLFPIGIAAVWTLNALRIAILVSIGAHVSPDVAVQGFHSAAGWISFLFVTLSVIAVSWRVPFFAAHAGPIIERVAERPASGSNAALLFLAPFIALMATSILASAFTPHDQWLYAVKVAAMGAVVWWFRDAYLPLLRGAAWSSVGIGLAVGVVWIATDPDKGQGAALGDWLASLPLWALVTWLGLRAFGSVVLVPIAEELAFRGYLSRLLISSRFESVGIGEYRPLAFIVSTVAFGAMHQRWLAAGIAGAIYALLMYRTKRLADPIAAHVASNAAIMVWAIVAQQWSLL
jgi:exosortase E/protease (VPEID-CTERM system)